ncbi:hypothetical protein E4T39_01115 [Aureobasidium subglaciale]|nr:hypothetical protein E4T39_01115 [Aureobasidium subglaciale]
MRPIIMPVLQDLSTAIKSAQGSTAKLMVLINSHVQDLMKDEQRLKNLITGFLDLHFAATAMWAVNTWFSLPSLCSKGFLCFAFKVHFFYLPGIACLIYNAPSIRDCIRIHAPVVARYISDCVHDAIGNYWRVIKIQEGLNITLPPSPLTLDSNCNQGHNLPDMEELFDLHLGQEAKDSFRDPASLLADLTLLRELLVDRISALAHISVEAKP